MIYIDDDGKKVRIKLNKFKFLDSGGFGKVYYNKDFIFKKYYSGIPNDQKFKKREFDILKQINSPNFIKLYDSYIEYNSKKTNFYKEYLDAYTAKYYQKEDIIPAFINKDYLLENLKKLDDLFVILSDNEIETYDVRVQNTVLTKENIVIIDPDFFEIDNNAKKEVLIWKNKIMLLNLVKCLLQIKLDYSTMKKIEKWFDDNFKVDQINENTDLAYELSKKLKYIKNPIEILGKDSYKSGKVY